MPLEGMATHSPESLKRTRHETDILTHLPSWNPKMPRPVPAAIQGHPEVDEALSAEGSEDVRSCWQVTELCSTRMLGTKGQSPFRAFSAFTSRSPSTLPSRDTSASKANAIVPKLSLSRLDVEFVQRLSSVEDTSRLMEEHETDETRQMDGNIVDRALLLANSPFASGLHTRCPSRESLDSEEDKTMQVSASGQQQGRRTSHADNWPDPPQEGNAEMRKISGDRYSEVFQGEPDSRRCETRELLELRESSSSAAHLASKAPPRRERLSSLDTDRGDGRPDQPQSGCITKATETSAPPRSSNSAPELSDSPTIRASSPKLSVRSVCSSAACCSPTVPASLDVDRLRPTKALPVVDCIVKPALLSGSGSPGLMPSGARAVLEAATSKRPELPNSEAGTQLGALAVDPQPLLDTRRRERRDIVSKAQEESAEATQNQVSVGLRATVDDSTRPTEVDTNRGGTGKDTSSRVCSETVLSSYASVSGDVDGDESFERSRESRKVEPTSERQLTLDKTEDCVNDRMDAVLPSTASSTNASETFASDLKEAAEGARETDTELDGDEEERQLREQLVRLQRRLLEVHRRQQSQQAEGKCRDAPSTGDPLCSGDRLASDRDCRDSEARLIATLSRTNVSTADGSSHSSTESAVNSPGGKENFGCCQRTMPSCEPLPASLRGGAAFALGPHSPLSGTFCRPVLQCGVAETPEWNAEEQALHAASRVLGFQTISTKENDGHRGRLGGSADGLMAGRFGYEAGAGETSRKRKIGDTDYGLPRQKAFLASAVERERTASSCLSMLAANYGLEARGSMPDPRISRLLSLLSRSESAKTNDAAAGQLLVQLLAGLSNSDAPRALHRWTSAATSSNGAYEPNGYRGGNEVGLESAASGLWPGHAEPVDAANASHLERTGACGSLMNLLESTLARAARGNNHGIGENGAGSRMDEWAGPSEEWRMRRRGRTGDYCDVQGSFLPGGSNRFSLLSACDSQVSRFRRVAAFLEEVTCKTGSAAESVCDGLGRAEGPSRGYADSPGLPGLSISTQAGAFPGTGGHGLGAVPEVRASAEGVVGNAHGIRLGDKAVNSSLSDSRVDSGEAMAHCAAAGEERFGGKQEQRVLTLRQNEGLAADGLRQTAVGDEKAPNRDLDVVSTQREEGPDDVPLRAVRGVYFDVTNQAWAANMRVNGKVQKRSFSLKRYGKHARQRAIEARREMEREFGRSVSQIVRASNFFGISRDMPEETEAYSRLVRQTRGFDTPKLACVQVEGERERATPRSLPFESRPYAEASLAARALLKRMQQDSAARTMESATELESFLYPHAVATRLQTLSRQSHVDFEAKRDAERRARTTSA
uniref:AP2 domain transcription factor AP2IX-9 n=1 Tax=Toxoplasma gondii COUG TaxID=1074873 RepID=A0A2G8XMV8_TOXGO|nr:AP2 domain transcription factor AP2IX-9 [Toxoplasma gondii COUG]